MGDVSWTRAFEDAWPAVARAVRDVLRARRVPTAHHEDYLQEVAARAIAAQVEFDGAADLIPWATTVARRLHIGELRRAERRDAALRRVRCAVAPDAAAAAVARLDLEHVMATVASWPQADRETLFDDGQPASGATYVRRHRLRAKLLAAIDGLGGVVAGWRRVRYSHPAEAGQLASAAAAVLAPAAAVVCALLLPGGVAEGDAGRHAAAPAAATALAAAAPGHAIVGGRSPTPSAAPSVAPTGGTRPSTDGGTPEGKGRRVDSPVETWVEVDTMGGRDPYAGIDNRAPDALVCASVDGVVAQSCVDQPGGTLYLPVP